MKRKSDRNYKDILINIALVGGLAAILYILVTIIGGALNGG